MEHRKLGNSGLTIAPLVFGGNVFGWTVDEARSFELLDAFLAAGFNCVDTADVYSRWAPGNKGGELETILGNWMKQRGTRNGIVLATKIGNEVAPDKKGLTKAYILRGVEDSLKRLQTDYIDLYQSHRDDMVTPVEETLEAYALLIKQGKVRAIGASNFDVKRLSELPGSQQERRPAALRDTAAPLQLVRTRRLRSRSRGAVPQRGRGCDQLLRASQRLFDRQVPVGSRSRQERARRRHQEVSQRARPAHLAGAR